VSKQYESQGTPYELITCIYDSCILHVFVTRGVCVSTPVYVCSHVTSMYESLITSTRVTNLERVQRFRG